MRRVRAGVRMGMLWPLISWVAACGGKYDGLASQEPASMSPAPSAHGSSRPSTGSPSSLPTHALGPCVPGFDRARNPALACAWISETDQCFDSFDAACACICPTSGNSLCSAGFSPNVTGATAVYCDGN